MIAAADTNERLLRAYAPAEREELRKVLFLAFPILVGQLSSAAAGLVDAAMVAPLGLQAMAAVGYGTLIFFVIVSLTVGIEAATQTLSARRTGEGRAWVAGHTVTEGLRLALLIGIPAGLVFAAVATPLTSIFHDDAVVQEDAGIYLALRAPSLLAVIAMAAFRGYYNGSKRPWMHLRVALVVLAAQVLFNSLLIRGAFGLPAMGVAGAGLSASLASLVGLATFLLFALRDRTAQGVFERADLAQRRQLRGSLLRLGLPSGLQWALSWIAMLLFLYLAGRVGVAEAGASYLLIQVASLITLAANSFGFASASLVSESLGRQNPAAAFRWGLRSGLLALCILGSIGLALALWREPLLAALSDKEELARVAGPALLLCGICAGLDALGIVMNFSLIGAGAAKEVMVANLLGMWLVCLPLAWYLGTQTNLGMLGLWAALLGARLLVAGFVSLRFYQQRWADLRV